jgi:hypothetical protein
MTDVAEVHDRVTQLNHKIDIDRVIVDARFNEVISSSNARFDKMLAETSARFMEANHRFDRLIDEMHVTQARSETRQVKWMVGISIAILALTLTAITFSISLIINTYQLTQLQHTEGK